jgi:hypothetical protein
MERGYSDTWGLLASSTDARFLLDLGRRFMVGPHARFHVQRPVTFWKRAYVSGPGWDFPLYRTGDRELGPLWTATGGFSFAWRIGGAANPNSWTIAVNGDGMYTSFLDDLYILNRTGGLASLALEGVY